IASTPTLGSDGTIYIGTDDANGDSTGVFAIDPVTQHNRHVFSFSSVSGLESDIDSSLAISSGGTLYFIAEHDNFFAALDSTKDVNSQSLIWAADVPSVIILLIAHNQRFGVDAHFNSSPAIAADGTVYVGARQGISSISPLGDATLFSPRLN